MIPVTSGRGKAVAGWTLKREGTVMKRFLIIAALGLFLAAHGVVALMTVYPQEAKAGCDGCS